MGLASVVHNRLYAPPIPKLDARFVLRVSQSPKWTNFCYNFPHIPRLRTGDRAGHCRFSPISCSRGTERRGGLSPSASEKSKVNERYASSVRNVALWVSTALAFGVGLGFKEGIGKASEFFAGYLLEQSLSVDNLFVFVLIFKYFQVPHEYQNRVLSYGIAGAVVFRLMIILLGTAALQRFEAVNILLAAILLYSSFKLFSSDEDDSDLSDNFVVKTCQRFIPVTANYDGNQFFTVQDGLRKVSTFWAGHTFTSHSSSH